MQFTLLASVLVACMTVFVSASPVPVPQQIEIVQLLARELETEVARSPEPEANPEPICATFTCM